MKNKVKAKQGFFDNKKRSYMLVLGFLLFQMVFYYFFTYWFS